MRLRRQPGGRPARCARAVVAVLLLGAVLGCASDQGGQGGQGGQQVGDTRFVAGDGKVVLFDAVERRVAPVVAGPTLDGGTVSTASYQGKVIVLNFWASWCGPCRAEAPVLKEIAARTKASGVEFLGINFKDRPADARAFERTEQPGYPSIVDQPGKIALSFQGSVPPAAIPATLIIDRRGRIAARALGAVTYSDLLNAVTQVSHEK
ncbi:TlpA family protein disulfide reductase [Nonomuraea rubra]